MPTKALSGGLLLPLPIRFDRHRQHAALSFALTNIAETTKTAAITA